MTDAPEGDEKPEKYDLQVIVLVRVSSLCLSIVAVSWRLFDRFVRFLSRWILDTEVWRSSRVLCLD